MKVRIGKNEKYYRFQCLGCYQGFVSYVPLSAAFSQHVSECQACPFPYDLPEDVEKAFMWQLSEGFAKSFMYEDEEFDWTEGATI